MTSSNKILEFVAKTRMTGMTQGSARALLIRHGDQAVGTDVARFANEVYEIPRATRPTVIHPTQTNTARSYRRESDDLTPAELVWLQRLPLEPEKVTHDDAARLAGMAGSIERMKSPSSYQLVQSIWNPVREIHDLKVAEENAKLVRESLPPVPESTERALQSTLRSEHPDWPDSAISAHANELLNETLTRRTQDHEQAVRQADETLARLRAEATDRVALERATA